MHMCIFNSKLLYRMNSHSNYILIVVCELNVIHRTNLPEPFIWEPDTMVVLMIDRQAWVSRNRRADFVVAGELDRWAALAALAAIPPNSHADNSWLGWDDEWRLPSRGGNTTNRKQKTFKKKKTRWMGSAYCVGLVFCHSAHSGEERGTRDEDVTQNNSL